MKKNDDIITTQFIKKDFDLSQSVDEEFLDSIKNQFGDNDSVIANANGININLLKEFPKNRYNFEYENAIKLIYNYLKELKQEFEFIEITFHDKIQYGFNPSFNIKVPNYILSNGFNEYSEEVFEKVGNFAEANNIDFILDDLSIIFCR